MIWVGTSGFQYPEWKGSFYPPTLPAAKMLPFYAERFHTTEINYSFYRVPSAGTLTNWAGATPDSFRFAFKAPREISHVRRLRNCGSILNRFVEAIAILEGKLGPALFQLPPFFKKDVPLLKEFLEALPRGLNCAFEFRHASWFDDETFDALKSKNAALCIADTEKLSTPVVVTGRFGYFRLRKPGYTTADIARWAEAVSNHEHVLDDTYVYFKHEESGEGPRLAKELAEALASHVTR